MVEGYLDGRCWEEPEPGENRSEAQRHGFQSGRDDLTHKPSAPFHLRLADADRISENG